MAAPDEKLLAELLDRGYRYALALSGVPVVAEDLVQEAMLRMLRRSAPMEPGYLFRTIRNRFIDEHRAMKLAVLHREETAAGAADDLAAEQDVDARDLEAALTALRPEEREVLFLVGVCGHTLAETAELTERPAGTAASLLRRGRARLLQLLSENQEAAS